jgi:hypothetical protein
MLGGDDCQVVVKTGATRRRVYVVKASRRHGWEETKSSGAKLMSLAPVDGLGASA